MQYQPLDSKVISFTVLHIYKFLLFDLLNAKLRWISDWLVWRPDFRTHNLWRRISWRCRRTGYCLFHREPNAFMYLTHHCLKPKICLVTSDQKCTSAILQLLKSLNKHKITNIPWHAGASFWMGIIRNLWRRCIYFDRSSLRAWSHTLKMS